MNYTQVWRGIEDARELLLGSYREAFNQLPRFCEKMAEANPGSNITLFTGDDRRFQPSLFAFMLQYMVFRMVVAPLFSLMLHL